MINEASEQLKNVPCNENDAYRKLKGYLKAACDFNGVDDEGKRRLNDELKIIRQTGTAKLFFFAVDLIWGGDGFPATMGIEGCSYVNWLLRITNVNPLTYNLPFGRFFHKKKDALPAFNIYVSQKYKNSVVKHLYKKYGKDCFVRGGDDENEYFASLGPIDKTIIKECLTVTTANGKTYEENVSSLTSDELKKSNFYRFGIIGVETLQYSAEDEFDEDCVLEEKKILFNDKYRNSISPFTEIEEIKNYLKDTEYKLIYQEQFMEICKKFLKIDYASADVYRKTLAQRQKNKLKKLKRIICRKCKENGEKLFDYLYEMALYWVSKAYVIANLYNIIDEEIEEW